jgi:hypothetical protein
MKLSLLITFLALLVPIPALADLMSTRPDDATVRAATANCKPASVTPASGIVGISDPHADDPAVARLIAETGVTWVRAEFHWSIIRSKTDGNFNWTPYDQMVKRYNRLGIKVQAILTYVPEDLPRDWTVIDAEFQKFANAAVRRYSKLGVHYWEVFNEPNLTGYGWLDRGELAEPYLGAYARLVARVNAAVRKYDPEGVVLLGGLAVSDRRALSPEVTMQRLFDLGVGTCFDVFAFHPYGYQNKFGDARARADAILKAGGAQGKPVWFNEYGWTDQNAMSMQFNRTKDTNPMMAVFAQRDNAGALFWFAAKDYSGRPDAPKFGLADYNLNKRPSFETFRKLVQGSR